MTIWIRFEEGPEWPAVQIHDKPGTGGWPVPIVEPDVRDKIATYLDTAPACEEAAELMRSLPIDFADASTGDPGVVFLFGGFTFYVRDDEDPESE